MTPDPRWQPGERIGDFELLEALGRGATGAVFRVRDLSTTSERALKTIRLAGPDSLARFRREAEAMAALKRHPNLVQVHSVGEIGGQPYLLMELVTGGDLSARLDDGPLPIEEAVAIVAALARALQVVHDRGVLHRDLKPANVVFDAHGTPKLTDFGLARVLGSERLTRTGELLGTPAYMAPESVDNAKVDARSDVYSLGALLYECLCGSPPFADDIPFRLLIRVQEEPPPPLPASVPPALAELCLQALAKDPGQRPQSAGELAELLERSLTSESGLAPGPSALLLVSAGALALLLGAGLTLAVLGSQRRQPGRALSPPAGRSAIPASPSPAPDPTLVSARAEDDETLWAEFRASLPQLPRDEQHIPSWIPAERRLMWQQALEVPAVGLDVGRLCLERGDFQRPWGWAWLIATGEDPRAPQPEAYLRLAKDLDDPRRPLPQPWAQRSSRLARIARRRGAEQGSLQATLMIGLELVDGGEEVTADPAEARRLLLRGHRLATDRNRPELAFQFLEGLTRLSLRFPEVAPRSEALAMLRAELHEGRPHYFDLYAQAGLLLQAMGRGDEAQTHLGKVAEFLGRYPPPPEGPRRNQLVVEAAMAWIGLPHDDPIRDGMNQRLLRICAAHGHPRARELVGERDRKR